MSDTNRLADGVRRVSFTLPENLARHSKAEAVLRGITYDQFLRESVEATLQRLKETAAA